jgi:hypothetical protein
MKSLKTALCTTFGIAFSLIAGTGCPGGGTVAEPTEEQVAEAVANQAISAYYETSFDATTGTGATIGVACTRGGELTWAEKDVNGEVCYQATSNGCVVDGAYGTITLQGDYTICGFPATIEEGGTIQDLDGKTLYLDGNLTATNEDGMTKTCDYNLDLEKISVTTTGETVTFGSSITGTLCSGRDINLDTSFTVSGQMEVSE